MQTSSTKAQTPNTASTSDNRCQHPACGPLRCASRAKTGTENVWITATANKTVATISMTSGMRGQPRNKRAAGCGAGAAACDGKLSDYTAAARHGPRGRDDAPAHRSMCAPFSAIMTVGELVLPEVMV